MSSETGSSKGAKIAIGLLIFVLVLMVLGGIAYRRQVTADQQEQQAQINALNKQVSDTKASANERSADAQSQREDELNQKNAALQKQLDAANAKASAATTTPQSSSTSDTTQ